MSGKKIVSNLAEYKNGQLTCIVCRVPVKNELYWTGHVNGRQHRDSIVQLKRKAGEDSQQPGSAAKKSKTEEKEEHVFLKPRVPSTAAHPVPNDVQDRIIYNKSSSTKGQPPAKVSEKEVPALKKSPIVEFVDEVEDDDDEDITENIFPAQSNQQQTQQKQQQAEQPSASLPEGFFDDPKEDAKVRGKEFVDPKEAEWSNFLKEIASEEIQSETLLVVDEEESRKERELDEIEEQMGHWQRVIDLEKKKQSRVKKMETDEAQSDSSEDEADFNEELDWRVKRF